MRGAASSHNRAPSPPVVAVIRALTCEDWGADKILYMVAKFGPKVGSRRTTKI